MLYLHLEVAKVPITHNSRFFYPTSNQIKFINAKEPVGH